jgi:hypothetical protein
MSVFADVYTALASLGLPLAANIYQAAEGIKLPDRFLVYSLIASPPVQAADNVEKLRANYIQVSLYDRSGLNNPPDIDSAMVAAGFVRGSRREMPYNQLTGHFGLAMEYVILEES